MTASMYECKYDRKKMQILYKKLKPRVALLLLEIQIEFTYCTEWLTIFHIYES
jgi:hypothetical protein